MGAERHLQMEKASAYPGVHHDDARPVCSRRVNWMGMNLAQLCVGTNPFGRNLIQIRRSWDGRSFSLLFAEYAWTYQL
jgi:hypothetical protein